MLYCSCWPDITLPLASVQAPWIPRSVPNDPWWIPKPKSTLEENLATVRIFKVEQLQKQLTGKSLEH